MKEIRISKKVIKKDYLYRPYIISEIGVNHEGDIDLAKKMIRDIASAGGDAVKFQVYKAEKLASKDSPAYWDLSKESTKSQFELFKKHDSFSEDEFKELAKECRSFGVDFLATPFDESSIDFLDSIVPAFKVASADITNKKLIKQLSGKQKPILLSTGASTMAEIWNAIRWINDERNDQIVLLHCVLNYPTKYEDSSLGMIRYMNDNFKSYPIGYSDHTLAENVQDILTTAWLLGARILEKHYTINKNLAGNDHYHAMDYLDLRNLILKFEFIKSCMGKSKKEYITEELPARLYARRSIYSSRFIPRGKTLEESDFIAKRPGIGIPPYLLESIIGSKARVDIDADTVICLNDIELAKNIKFD